MFSFFIIFKNSPILITLWLFVYPISQHYFSRSSSWNTVADKSSPTNRKRAAGSLKIHDRSTLKNNLTNGSTPDLALGMYTNDTSNSSNASSSTRNSPNMFKNLLNGYDDASESDGSGKNKKITKPKKMWKLLSDSRKNSDPKWKHLMDSLPASP